MLVLTVRRLVTGLSLCLLAAALIHSVAVSAEGLRLDLARLEHPFVTLEGVSLSVADEAEPARLRIARAEFGGFVLHALDLACSRLELADGWVRCRGGRLELPGLLERATVDLEFDVARNRLQIRLQTPEGESLALGLLPDGSFHADLSQARVARLSALLPLLSEYAPQGRVSGSAVGRAATGSTLVTFDLRLSDGGFVAGGGLNAAEGIGLRLAGRLARDQAGWQWSMGVDWTGGEAYVHPLYLEAGLKADLSGRFDGKRLSLDGAKLEIGGVRAIELRASVEVDPLRVVSGAVAVADADLSVIGSRYLMPLVAPALSDRIQFKGLVSAGGRYESGDLLAVDVSFSDVSVSLDDGLFGIGPVNGVVPWRAFESGLARLDVGAANWESLSLDAFRVEAHVHDNAVDFESVSVPVLDGRLVVSDLSLERRADGWYGQGGAFIEPLSLESLTRAVGMPVMSGVLSAALPALVVQPGSLSLDGTLVISMFGGYVRVFRLELREPLGVAAYLTADLEARNLDLGKITNTFAFGNVTGFIDADVLGLELVRWRPVAFDATVRSSPGRYARRISQRAVQNIGALGGGGAVMALQRGFLGFFESFGYRELGLSCKLSEGVCLMGGIAGDSAGPNDGFIIVRGGGVPSLNVIGYNRRVDWQELLARLQGAIASNTGPVIE